MLEWQRENMLNTQTKLNMIKDVLKHKNNNRISDKVAIMMIESIMKVGQE